MATQETLKVTDHLSDLSAEQGRLATLDEYRNMTEVERGIGASLGISYKLLNEEQQRFWRGLSVFPGGFDAGAAGNVGQSENFKAADKTLGALHAASMVQWDEATGRFRLHDLARDYGRDRLSEAERGDVEERHAAHYLIVLARADELFLEGGDSILLGLALFDLEWGNIVAGQAWAAAQRETGEIAAKLCNAYPTAGVYCIDLRLHSRERIAWLDAALEAARTLNDRKAEGNHLGNLGLAYADLGEPRKAIEYHEQDLVISKEIGDRRGEGQDLGNLGLAYADLGEPRKAIEYHEQALAISKEIGDWRGEGQDLGNLGLAYADLGEPRKAIEFYEQILVIFQEIGDRRGEGNALGNMGLAYAYLGEPRKAIEFYEQHIVIAKEIGDRLGEGNTSHNIAGELFTIGRVDEAIAYAERAVEIYEQIESPNLADARAQLEKLRKQRD